MDDKNEKEVCWCTRKLGSKDWFKGSEMEDVRLSEKRV